MRQMHGCVMTLRSYVNPPLKIVPQDPECRSLPIFNGIVGLAAGIGLRIILECPYRHPSSS